MPVREAVIISGSRTPIGNFGGAFKDIPASELGAITVKDALLRANLSGDDVEEVIFGNVLQAAEAGYAARRAALKAGIPQRVPAITVNRACSSGLEAINLAAQLIRAGEIDIAVAGGTESMSQAPYLLDGSTRFDGLPMGNVALRDSLIEGLSCPVNRFHMGVGAEILRERFEIEREDQDRLALQSHKRAVAAIESGRFKSQIVPVPVPGRDRTPVTADEGPRADTSFEKLIQLQPVFKEGGTITAGNSSSVSDGAASVVIASAEKATELGMVPRLRWIARSVAGVDPALYGIAPVPAVRSSLTRAGLTLGNIDVIELNEAFAAQALHNIRELELDMDRTNINGSGISLGHPLGATGAIQTVKLMEELARQDKEFGLVTMCVGGGMGVATIFERIN